MPKEVIIKQVFNPYIHRINPFEKFHPLIVANNKLLCYPCYLQGQRVNSVDNISITLMDEHQKQVGVCSMHKELGVIPLAVTKPHREVVEVMSVKVVNMYKTNSAGKIVAFFDIDIGKVLLKGARLVNGANGFFVSPPSQKYTNKEGKDVWKNYWEIDDRQFAEAVLEAAKKQYGGVDEPDSSWLDEDIPQ